MIFSVSKHIKGVGSRYVSFRRATTRRYQNFYALRTVSTRTFPQRTSRVHSDSKAIVLSGGSRQHMRLHNLWLRDHCQCPGCLHQETRQRLVDTFEIPRDIKAAKVSMTTAGLHVTWANDRHQSLYTWRWLELHGGFGENKKDAEDAVQPVLWGSELRDGPPKVQYEEVMMSEEGIRDWTSKLVVYGMCYVEGCPVSPEKTEQLLRRIAVIRHTHYGGFWDFTSNLASKDTAYTSLALRAHTDTTYFSDPAGLQMFHLLSHSGGSGGMSLLVDGFRAAQELREKASDAYDILSRVRVPTHASGNEGISIRPFAPFPVLNHHPVTGKLMQIRWNNDDRATMDQWRNEQDLEQWYDATRLWAEILRRKDIEYWEQLQPGIPLIFDNWRVLHGRSAFTGERRMCGGYISRDDFVSRYLITNRDRGDILQEI